jgi:DNA adenine methylase
MDKTFPYPGIKHHLLKYMPARIEGAFYDLFLGSGLVSYNLCVSKKHMGVDIDPNVILMHRSIKNFPWEDMDKLQTYVNAKWDLSEKEDYYAYREWFNRTLWSTDHKKTGLGLLLLARSCINGLIRFGPNGFNQSSGLRFIPYDQSSYTRLHDRAKSIDFVCDDFRNVKVPKNSFIYADPPYLTNPIDTYGNHWKPETLRQTLRLCISNTFWYTDTENKVNASFIKHYSDSITNVVLKEMRSQSPGSGKTQVLTGRNELLITNWVNRFYGNT